MKCVPFRMEDLTDPEQMRQNPKCDRKVSLYGYVRGAHLKHNSRIHLIGEYSVTCPMWNQSLVVWSLMSIGYL